MANAVQITYSNTIPIGYPGMVANGEPSNRISRSVESSAGIGFGQPAFRGTGDHGCIVGATFAATGAGSAAAGNVGTSTISATPAVAAGAKQGRYVVTQLNTSATGALQIADPEGNVVGHGNVGTEFVVAGVTATVTAGGTATAGDQWYVDVTYTANASLLGIVMADHGVQPLPSGVAADIVPQYGSAGIMNKGVIWVTAGATVAPGDDVYWNPATSRFTKTTTHIRLAGWVFDTSAVSTGLVRIARR